MKPLFIVFEGIDGCGKSTQIWEIAKFLSSLNKYNHVLVTREPYKEKEIRKILREDVRAEEKAEKLAELFVKDRKEHISDLILPNLKEGVFVISDRYKYATICYQSAQGQDIKKLIDIHKDMLVPDITFIIDVPVEIAIERMKKDKRDEQKFEKDSIFLEKVRQNYLNLPKLLPEENIIVIDGNRDIEKISSEIQNLLIKSLML